MLRVMAEERPERSTDPFGRIMPDRLWDIIQVCWSHNPLDRSSMTQVVELMMNANTDFRIEIIPVITRLFLSELLPGFTLIGFSGGGS